MSLGLKSNNHQNNVKGVKLSDSAIYEFEEFRLDSAKLMLYRNEEEISLPPKQVETLLALVERGGEIVGKETLMERLWPNAFVEESNLVQNIYILRKILGETVGGKPMIETLRRRGYRFNGELKANGHTEPEMISSHPKEAFTLLKFPPETTSEPVAINPDAVDLPRRGRNVAVLAVALLFLVVSIGLGFYFFTTRTPAVVGKKTIAVLPLKPINAANRDELYEIGIADSLIHHLSSMKGFVVRPLSAVRKHADIEQDPIAAGKEQQVDYVLASNYQLADGRVRITAQLFNVATGQIEETYKSDKDSSDIFTIQDAVASEFGNKLMVRFAATAGGPMAKRGTTNEEAYRLYLQGMYILDKRNPADARKAAEIFDQAVRLDPNYAQAWAGKAHAHRAVANYGRDTNIHEEYRNSIAAITKALALDEKLADAHSALCENKMLYEWDFDGAEKECRRAIELDPNSSLAHQIYSRYLMGRGRFDEALAEINIAIDLEPASLFNQRLYGNTLYNARRYDEAALQFRRVIAMDPNFGSTYHWLVNALEMQGNYDEAFDWFMKAQVLQKRDDETIQLFRAIYQKSGWQGILREQARQFENSDDGYFRGACLSAQIGNKNKAFEYLEKSYQRREWSNHLLKVEPRLASLRGDPRFDDLLRRVESK